MANVQKYQRPLAEAEKEIGFQFLPLAVCPLPPRPPSLAAGEDWVKSVGKTTIRIVSSSRHGIPYGRDILIVLYLIQEALRQGGPVIKFSSLNHYLGTFNLSDQGTNYKEAVDRFKRVFYSSWFWEDKRQDGNGVTIAFRVVRSWNVFFDDTKGQNPLFDSFIELTPEFWEILQKHPIPYKLDSVIQFKDKPAVLNLYLYLVYRTWQNWHGKKGKEFVPFFGDAGLQKQLSSDIARTDHFRKKLHDWIDEIKTVWPECPIGFERETDPNFMGKNRQKKYKDGLFINVKSVDQLHVGPHWPKEIRLAQEESAAAIEAATPKEKPCPKCGASMKWHRGVPDSKGVLQGNYYKCLVCKKNFGERYYPELFKKE